MRLLLAAVAFLSGCTTVQLSRDGQRVRITEASPHNCKYVAEIQMSVLKYSTLDDASNAVKNRAAEMGANTVKPFQFNNSSFRGEAYNCIQD